MGHKIRHCPLRKRKETHQLKNFKNRKLNLTIEQERNPNNTLFSISVSRNTVGKSDSKWNSDDMNEFVVDRGSSGQIVHKLNLLTNVQPVPKGQVQLPNRLRFWFSQQDVLSLWKCLERIKLINAYSLSPLNLNIMSCSRFGGKGVTTTVIMGCSVWPTSEMIREIFGGTTQRPSGGLFVTQLLLHTKYIDADNKFMTESYKTHKLGARSIGAAARLWFYRMSNANIIVMVKMMQTRKYCTPYTNVF